MGVCLHENVVMTSFHVPAIGSMTQRHLWVFFLMSVSWIRKIAALNIFNQQGSPPAWPQEAYRLQRILSVVLLCSGEWIPLSCPEGGNPVLARGYFSTSTPSQDRRYPPKKDLEPKAEEGNWDQRLGYPPPCGQTHTHENITFRSYYVRGR